MKLLAVIAATMVALVFFDCRSSKSGDLNPMSSGENQSFTVEESLSKAEDEANKRQDELEFLFSKVNVNGWERDRAAMTLSFLSENDKVVLTYRYAVIGTYAPEDETFKFGWSNPSFNDPERKFSAFQKDMAKQSGIGVFEEDGSLQMGINSLLSVIAMSVVFYGADGYYMVPSENPKGKEVNIIFALIQSSEGK